LGASVALYDQASHKMQCDNADQAVAGCFPGAVHVPRPPAMFAVSEEAAAIRAVYEQDGELSAAIELRRRFHGIIDNAKARDCARTIAEWTPPPKPPVKARRPRPRKDR
jgi:hypothetical protein